VRLRPRVGRPAGGGGEFVREGVVAIVEVDVMSSVVVVRRRRYFSARDINPSEGPRLRDPDRQDYICGFKKNHKKAH